MIEPLEARRLMSVVTPSNDEQYMLELVNRARANPSGEAAADGIALNEGLSAGTISAAAKQPLAFNVDLIASARGHSQWMLDNQEFQHNGPGTTGPGDRMTAAGYDFSGTSGWGENIAYRGTTGTLNNDTTTAGEHQDLFVDSGETGRGHRVNIENSNYKEIGVGITTGVFDGYHALMTTQDFAYSGNTSFLTGVAYSDAITADHFYEPGEGFGGIAVTATNTTTNAVFTTTTWSSGGYTLALPAGTYAVTASGTSLGSVTDGTLTIGSQNVTADFTPSSTPITTGGNPGGVATATKPTAALAAKNMTASASTYSFTVTYTGTSPIDATTFDKHDITVTGPNGYRASATFLGAISSAGGKVQKVTYRLSAPVKKWAAANDGVYHVYVRPSQVADSAGHFVDALLLGYFKIRI